MDRRIWPPEAMALLTDYYQLTMMAGYVHHGRQDTPAVFEYFFRALPSHTGFCVFAGLGDLLDDLENLHFSADAVGWLRSLGTFPDEFLDWLPEFRFRGEVWAMPEGTPVFPHEPIVRVHGGIAEAQLIETLLLNRLNFQTLVATKAARVCFAAEGDPVIEFGLRRAQGPDGALSASRAAYIGGCCGTSNVLAGKLLGIPVLGTMAHSWIMSYPDEKTAFQAYLDIFPRNPVLLIDTYDTAANGLPAALDVLQARRKQGWEGRAAVRLDSGDLAYLSKLAHRTLTEAGFEDPLIVGSNDLDEELIADLKRQGARINSWGVGTHLVTGGSEPALSGVYKLVAVAENGRMTSKMKVSSNIEKTTDPGPKRVVRYYRADGAPVGDVLLALDEELPAGKPCVSHNRVEYARTRTFGPELKSVEMLQCVLRDGRRVAPGPDIHTIRAYALERIAELTPEMRRLRNPERYWVGLSTRVADEKAAEISRLTEAAR
jgi:nicotinate phosphoribosyltransferase